MSDELQYWAHKMDTEEVAEAVSEGITAEQLLGVMKDMLLEYRDFVESDPDIKKQYDIFQAERKLKS